MTMNGSPFVYYGEEIGMNSSGTKDENKRIPMVWSKTDTTGMTKGPADMDAGIESPFPAEDEQEKEKCASSAESESGNCKGNHRKSRKSV